MLFIVFVIMHLSRDFWTRMSFKYSICTLLMLMVFLRGASMVRLVPHWLCLNQVGVYLPFFYLGVLSARFNFMERLRHFRFKPAVTLSALCIVLIIGCLKKEGVALFSSYSFSWLACGIPVAVAIVLIHAALEEKGDNIPHGYLLNLLDKNSMGIYILHHIMIIAFVNSPIGKTCMNAYPVMMPLLMFVIVLCLSLGISECINRTRLSFLF